MRVIAGTYRSRTLHAPRGMATRPTHARVREALFSMLGTLTNLRVLDLCAGTGALGIEALSRGAVHAVFVERAKDALECLTRNVRELGIASQATVIAQSIASGAAKIRASGPYDLIFCDPPWAKLDEVLLEIERAEVPLQLLPEGYFALEHSVKDVIAHARFPQLDIVKTRGWGDTAITLLCPTSSADDGAPLDTADVP